MLKVMDILEVQSSTDCNLRCTLPKKGVHQNVKHEVIQVLCFYNLIPNISTFLSPEGQVKNLDLREFFTSFWSLCVITFGSP